MEHTFVTNINQYSSAKIFNNSNTSLYKGSSLFISEISQAHNDSTNLGLWEAGSIVKNIV